MTLYLRPAARGDKVLLQAFTCTTQPRKRKRPPWGYEHPAEWELEVQTYVHKCNPVCGPGEQMWLLVDDDGPELVGCVRFEVSADGVEAFVKVLAVALDYRGMGVADILMQVVIDEVTTLAVQQPSIRRQSVVTAHVDKRNLRSRALASRQGLRNVGTVNGYELWQLIVDIEAVPEPAG